LNLPIDILARAGTGLDHARYLELLAERAAAPTEGLAPEDAERVEYTRLNLHRSLRIERTWKPSPRLAGLVAGLPTPQTWLVLTEPWCGDSAQCLPHIAALAALNPGVTLSILPRDDNLDVMDLFLTDGKRSIPVLIALDDRGGVIFRWGPRPAAAQEVFAAAKAEGLEKPAILEKLHLFYGRNRGRALEDEFITILSGLAGKG